MQVLFTVDTEFWPKYNKPPDLAQLEYDVQRDIYGRSIDGEFGVRFQLDALDSEGLKGVFFIEAISSLVTGVESLGNLITLVESRGHSVELHLHTEWLKWIQPSPLPGRYAFNMRQLSFDDQSTLINKGLMLFREAGLQTPVQAFRAGNYGADQNTLRALEQNGILFDTSYNLPYLNSACNIATPEPLLQPLYINGVLEVPVNCFQDYSGHYRHTQLAAASFGELRSAIEAAYDQKWNTFVIVSHSFELIKRNMHSEKAAIADNIMLKRFEKLLKYLGQNKDRYTVDGFTTIDIECFSNRENDPVYKHLKGSLLNTLLRFAQQALRRLLR